MAGGFTEGLAGFSDTHLSVLPSVQFYNDVGKNHENLSYYIQKCEQIIATGNIDDVKIICKKFLRHLENSAVWNVEKPGYDVCLLLNYWIYDKLYHIFSDQESSNIAFSNFQMISSYPNKYITKNLSYNAKCKYKIDFHMHEDWQKRKEFYDYCVDYKTLYGMVTGYDQNCSDFHDYLEKKEELYKHFEGLCSTEQTKCPEFYVECKEHNPNILLSKLPCHDEILRKKAAVIASASHHSSGQELVSGPPGHGPGLSEKKDGSHVAEIKPGVSQIGTKIGHSVLGVAPVLLTATALYRYTPIGSWIRKFGGYNQNSINEMEGFSSYTQGSGDMFADSAANYISYQPI
ncbi:PIR Superfamily Protein [Plasmodium ovale curtisi]|uniref:PIR Superfamily Protein n=1 Tax=Plasmodium ovale curtisi TaxID=864141 RepID=A0A1A8WS38_PLAOA|nr:PIR Superfamily Protein [Plasmodium ovale curtisi]